MNEFSLIWRMFAFYFEFWLAKGCRMTPPVFVKYFTNVTVLKHIWSH